MANPALIAKTIVMTLSDERLKKGICWIIVAVISPIIVVFAIIGGMLSGAANHNNSALEICFKGGVVSESMPENYRKQIESMQGNLSILDELVKALNSNIEEGDGLDPIRVKAIFYALYFGLEQSSSIDYQKFVGCFIKFEEQTITVTDSEGSTKIETTTSLMSIKDLSVVYQNINSFMGRTVAAIEMANATEIYNRIAYGKSTLLENNDTNGWEGWCYQPSQEELDRLYHELPVGELGSEIVLQAMKRLGDPYSQGKRGQDNYVDCSYLTMWCYEQVGISLPSTAAEQGRFCFNQGLTISSDDLIPGDLVFWSYEPNGRFMNITHVGIYAGDGKVIDASSKKGVVVYRNIFDANKQVLYGRPHVKQ